LKETLSLAGRAQYGKPALKVNVQSPDARGISLVSTYAVAIIASKKAGRNDQRDSNLYLLNAKNSPIYKIKPREVLLNTYAHVSFEEYNLYIHEAAISYIKRCAN